MLTTRTFARTTRVAATTLVLLVAGCERAPRPSIVLVVLDTVRHDAVSAYGRVADTTPTIDRLAAEGLLYRHAYANANWTLPSHVTLFTGLLPSQHGVNHVHPRVPDELTLLAERLQQAGYETVGVAENPWVGDANGFARGFDSFLAVEPTIESVLRGSSFDADALERRLAARKPDRPLFLFVNLMDAHAPYRLRHMRFLPAGATEEDAEAVARGAKATSATTPPGCGTTSRSSTASTSATSRRQTSAWARSSSSSATRAWRSRSRSSPRTTASTSASTASSSTSTGCTRSSCTCRWSCTALPGVRPAAVDAPVELADIVPSVLTWAGAPHPGDLPGRALPTTAGGPTAARTIIAENIEPRPRDGDDEETRAIGRYVPERRRSIAERCGPRDGVAGTVRAAIRYPKAHRVCEPSSGAL